MACALYKPISIQDKWIILHELNITSTSFKDDTGELDLDVPQELVSNSEP